MSQSLVQPTEIKRIRRDDPDKFSDPWVIYGKNFMITSSDNPAHPQGVWSCEWIDNWSYPTCWNTRLGKPSSWSALPITLQRVLVDFFTERK